MTSTSPSAARTGRSPIYAAVIGLAGLAVLLQAVWAGLFVHEGRDYKQSWVEVHARGADVAIVLALIAVVVLLVTARQRRDLIIGTVVFLVLLVVEAYLGGKIGDSPGITVIHFPLAMALMALSVWLPVRSTVTPAERR